MTEEIKVVISGRTGCGKTVLAHRVADCLFISEGYSFSIEGKAYSPSRDCDRLKWDNKTRKVDITTSERLSGIGAPAELREKIKQALSLLVMYPDHENIGFLREAVDNATHSIMNAVWEHTEGGAEGARGNEGGEA